MHSEMQPHAHPPHQSSSELISLIRAHQRPAERPSSAAIISGPPSGLICERSQTCRALSSSLIDGLIE